MTTLLEVVNRVKSMEGNYGTSDSVVESGVKSAINEGLDVLYAENPWWFNDTTATVTANSDGNLVMPAETNFVCGVYSGDAPLEARGRTRQLDAASKITDSGLETYALGGYDGTTGYPLVTVYPAGSGDYTVRYQPAPTALSADADEIPGPRAVAHYLTWYARWLRLETDEERINLRQSAELTASRHMNALSKQNKFFLSGLRRKLAVARA